MTVAEGHMTDLVPFARLVFTGSEDTKQLLLISGI